MNLAIPVRAPFDFAHTRAFVQSFPPCARDLVIEDDAVIGALAIGDAAVGWRLSPGEDGALAIEIEGPASAAPRAARAHADFVGADDDLADFYARAAGDAAPYRALVARLHGMHHVRFLSLAEITCYAVLMQRTPIHLAAAQKSALAAAFGRDARFGAHRLRAFPGFGDLVALRESDLARIVRHPEKARRLVAAIEAVAAMGEDFLRRAPYDDAFAALVRVRGIGEFSARAILLRGLGRMDQLDPRGPAFARAARAVYGADWSAEDTLDRYRHTIGYWSYYLRVGAPD
jgi:DNA-3-methyladenine glycosylase II